MQSLLLSAVGLLCPEENVWLMSSCSFGFFVLIVAVIEIAIAMTMIAK